VCLQIEFEGKGKDSREAGRNGYAGGMPGVVSTPVSLLPNDDVNKDLISHIHSSGFELSRE
jgi:hypothetical protein